MPTMWSISDDTLAAWTRRSLADVDDLLRSTLHSPGDPFLTTVATHLLAAGGKRLRPALVLLAARFGDHDHPHVVRAAAAVELMHVASLYHDDVMDEAPTRRGVPSVNARWSNRVAILAGDYLVARASELAAPLGADAVEEQARMLTRLVTGQLRETVEAGRHPDPERYYMSVIADKTAALFTLATRLGARASGAPAGTATALGAYGEALGIAFQLSDDLLDLAEPTARTGKPANADLREGVATLPVLRAIRPRIRGFGADRTRGQDTDRTRGLDTDRPRGQDATQIRGLSVSRIRGWSAGRIRGRNRAGGGRDSARLRRMLAAGPITDARELATVARLVRRSPGFAQTRAEVERYACQAQQALLALPAGPARDALHALCDDVVSRAAPSSA
ncbi:polyprenyl synthetase family protein [Sphaerisporangium perillae]|uniref:polyprenyl synthetase family protein n=1 Tax=Sphaerisporangium perillae TaxID=2935860 RepID=UPI00200D9D4A|nr:polyprenyl synthetase family protein [Sphaerisporangium perillae]